MITAGLATFVTVGAVLSERDDTVEVVVLASDAAAGTGVTDLHVNSLAVPVDAPFLDSMLRHGDLRPGLVLAHGVAAGSPLVRSGLVESGDSVLTRTAAIAVEPVSIVGLGLVVGDRVDVIGLDAEERAQFVLDDVRVARLPSTAGPEGLLTGPSATFVTLEVDVAQALALVTAQRRGPIELLRSTGAPAMSSPTATEDRP